MATDFGKNRKKEFNKSKFFLALGAVLFLALAAFFVFENIKMHNKRQELILQIENLKKEIAEKQQQKENLEEGIAKANDAEYIEKVAREELGLQQQGEKVVSFIMPEKQEEEQLDNKNKLGWLGWLSSFWQRAVDMLR